jgi:hypothetical protein
LLRLLPDRKLHVELAVDPEAFGLAVLAAPDCDAALADDLAVYDREEFVAGGLSFSRPVSFRL